MYRVLKKGVMPAADVVADLAEILDVSERWLLTGVGAMDRDAGGPETYDSLPGWAEAAKVETSRGRTQPYAIRAAGRSPVFVRPETVTADFVLQCAQFWLAHAQEEDRQAAMKAEAQRIKAKEDDRAKT
jgi:hypothetical protein